MARQQAAMLPPLDGRGRGAQPIADARDTMRAEQEHSKAKKNKRAAGRASQLLEQGFSIGLAQALLRNADEFECHLWVVDNSGSMVIGDGHRIVENAQGKIVTQSVTRWQEIQDTVNYHSQMAAALSAPTVFRLLNDPGPAVGSQEFSIAERGRASTTDIQNAKIIMNKAKPDGVTALTNHIKELKSRIEELLPKLRKTGRRVAIILATDGLPTDELGYGGDEVTEEFIDSLRSLQGLPVWLVIRLCTDETKVASFYSELDKKLELSLDVLGDYLEESREVYKFNPWLNYALPLHRCRELGVYHRLFDIIDERPLTHGELIEFCQLLFGDDEEIPNPVSDWKAFLQFVKAKLQLEKAQWNPIKKKAGPWINIKRLQSCFHGSACSIM